MGYHTKESPDTQMRLAKLYKRIYSLVDLPTMTIALILGLFLTMKLDHSSNMTWFMLKLTCVIGLFFCDRIAASYIRMLNVAPDLTKGVKYKMLHGIVGLLLIGILVSAYAVRDKETELLAKVRKELDTNGLAKKAL